MVCLTVGLAIIAISGQTRKWDDLSRFRFLHKHRMDKVRGKGRNTDLL
jgi:hypothetical protein